MAAPRRRVWLAQTVHRYCDLEWRVYRHGPRRWEGQEIEAAFRRRATEPVALLASRMFTTERDARAWCRQKLDAAVATRKPMKVVFVVNTTLTMSTDVEDVTTVEHAMRSAKQRGIQGLCHQCASGEPKHEWVTSGELDGDTSSAPLVAVLVDGEEIEGAALETLQKAWEAE